MADTAKHTPGPWEFGKERRWLYRDNLKADGNFSSSTILKVDNDAFRPSEADAMLIAAAPYLLATLREIAGNGDGAGRNPQLMVDSALAAIAKVEGV